MVALLKELVRRFGIDTSDRVGVHVTREALVEDPEVLQKAREELEKKHGPIDWETKLDKFGVVTEGDTRE